MFYIDSRKIHYELNKGYTIPQKIMNNKKFIANHNTLLGGIDRYSFAEKSYILGHLINDMLDDGINDDNIKIVKYFVDRLKTIKSKNDDKFELINIIYSTVLKKIRAKHIISGDITPTVYRELIDDSIKNYRENPTNGFVDYRHIAGRMLSLKKMNKNLCDNLGVLSVKYKPVRWDDELQLDFLTTVEKIFKNYNEASDNFSITKGFRYNFFQKTDYTREMNENKYKESITDLFKYTLTAVKSLLKNPLKNKEIIEDKLDIAYHYFDKISYLDPQISKFTEGILPLKNIEKYFRKILKKKI